MVLIQTRTCLLMIMMYVAGVLCQQANNAEEPVTSYYFFNRDVNFDTNATGSQPSGEEEENITQEVFGANARIWIEKIKDNDAYITSCGGMSTSAKTIWQNSAYPVKEKLPGICVLNLLPPAGTCALRIHFDDLDLLPAEPGYYYRSYPSPYYYNIDCPPSKPFFKASTPGDLTAIYCHNMDAYEGILAVSDTTEPSILLLQLDSTEQFQFKISVTAVNCNDIKTYESPSDCGIKNQDLATLRAGLFGDVASEQTQDPVVAKYGDHSPLAYRQKRRTSTNSGSQSQDQKNKKKNKNKNNNNSHANKEKGTNNDQQEFKEKLHPLIEEFKKVIAAAEAAGKISKPSGDRVTGKKTTLVNEWPWIVLIEKNINIPGSDYKYTDSCNGLLLDNSKVLTSRLCILEYYNQYLGVEDIYVIIGDHDLSITTETKSKTVSVSKITLPLKNTIYSQKDAFAILHLKEKVDLLHNIRPICLPVTYNSFDDSGVVAGWEMYYGNPYDPVPNEAEVKVLDQTRCKNVLDDYYWMFYEQIDVDNVVCTKIKESRQGAVCRGDEGNSLIQRDRRGAYYVTGVATSDIQECYYWDFPTIFSKIEPNNQFLNIALA